MDGDGSPKRRVYPFHFHGEPFAVGSAFDPPADAMRDDKRREKRIQRGRHYDAEQEKKKTFSKGHRLAVRA